MSQAIMSIHSLSKYIMMVYNSYTRVTVNLPKIFPFWARAIWAELVNVISHDSLLRSFWKFCGMMRHNVDRQK